jgi:hypothetical protein
MGVNLEAEDDDVIPYYETYSKKKFAYRNVFIRVTPPPAELAVIKEQVEEKISDFQKEIEVGLKEKEIQLQQAVEAGEMIPDRAQLEMEKAQKMAAQAVEEQRMQLTSEAQDAATIIKQQVMSESDFQILSTAMKPKRILLMQLNSMRIELY